METVQFDSAEVLVLAGSSNGSIKLWDLEEAKGVVHAYYKDPTIWFYSKTVHISLISFYACLKHGCFMLCSLQIPFRF